MKRKQRSGGGGANWMDTYGDMVTLLLCFFVLLYSMSTISEEKWKAVVQSFNPSAVETDLELEGNKGPVADPVDDPQGLGDGHPVTEPDKVEITLEDFDLNELYASLLEYSQQEHSGESFSVTKGGGKVFVTFNHNMMFNRASPELRSEIYPVLDEVCQMLDEAKDLIGEVRIIGHTAQGSSDHPNGVSADRHLASGRATNVTVYIQEHCSVDPARLVTEAMGQWRPIAPNDTEENRSRNRRVEIIISGRDLEEALGDDIIWYETVPQE